MRVPIRVAVCATFLALLSPARFLAFQERVARPLGIPVASSNDSVNKVSCAFREAFLIVAAAAIVGSVAGLVFGRWLGRPAHPLIIPLMQVVSALILLLATVYVRADAIRTYHGATLIERVDRWIYCAGYVIGTVAIVSSLVWPLACV